MVWGQARGCQKTYEKQIVTELWRGVLFSKLDKTYIAEEIEFV